MLPLLLMVALCACGGEVENQLKPIEGTRGMILGNPTTFSVSPSGHYLASITAPNSGSDYTDCLMVVLMEFGGGQSVSGQIDSQRLCFLTPYLWKGDTLYFCGIEWIPGMEPQEGVVSEEELSCSDCPDYQEFNTIAEKIYWHSNYEPRFQEIAQGTWHGHQCYFYGGRKAGADLGEGWEPLGTDRGTVYAYWPDESRYEKVVSHGGLGRKYSIEGVRQSPDEQYLAYDLIPERQGIFPLPSLGDQIWIYSFATGEKWPIGSLQFATNLMWSPDSRTLYVGGRTAYNSPGYVWTYEMPEHGRAK